MKFAAVGASEREVVQTRPTLIERIRSMRIGELVDADQCLAPEEPYDVVERTRVLIDDRRSPDEVLVPGPTPTEIGDGQRHVRYAGEFGHDTSLKPLDWTIVLRFAGFPGAPVRHRSWAVRLLCTTPMGLLLPPHLIQSSELQSAWANPCRWPRVNGTLQSNQAKL